MMNTILGNKSAELEREWAPKESRISYFFLKLIGLLVIFIYMSGCAGLLEKSRKSVPDSRNVYFQNSESGRISADIVTPKFIKSPQVDYQEVVIVPSK